MVGNVPDVSEALITCYNNVGTLQIGEQNLYHHKVPKTRETHNQVIFDGNKICPPLAFEQRNPWIDMRVTERAISFISQLLLERSQSRF